MSNINYYLDDERTVSVEYTYQDGEIEVLEVFDNNLRKPIQLTDDEMQKLYDWLIDTQDDPGSDE